jgi:hypothetical protein
LHGFYAGFMKFLILFTPVLKFQRSDPSITKHFTKLVFISLFSHRLEKTHTIRETVKFVAETLAQFFVLCPFCAEKNRKSDDYERDLDELQPVLLRFRSFITASAAGATLVAFKLETI